MGKTSLVDRFVHSIFSDKYLSSIGVKISKKAVTIDSSPVTLILWDMEGKDMYVNVNLAYLRGAMGFFVVADGTRKETLEVALSLRKAALEIAGNVPSCLLVNKYDLSAEWEITAEMIAQLVPHDLPVLFTSAKSGEGVEEAFINLTRAMLQEQRPEQER